MATTLIDLARQLNLSHTAVSRILNNDPTFRTTEATRERVRSLAHELGYRSRIAARHLKNRETRHIGLLLHQLMDPFFAQLAHGIEREVSAAGYSLSLTLGHTIENLAADGSRNDPCKWYIDGLIAGIYGKYADGVVAEWNRKMPVVLVGNRMEEAPFVTFDEFAGARQVGWHLVEQGYERIAYLGLPDHKRYPGLCAGVQETGGGPVENLEIPYESNELFSQRIEQRLQEGRFPDALFCYNDGAAALAFAILRRHGKRVPQEVGLVGFNDLPTAPYMEVPLSSVSVPTDAMCHLAVQAILQRLPEEEIEPLKAVLPTSLVVRASSLRRGE